MNKVEVLKRVGPLIDGQVRHVNDMTGARVVSDGASMSLRPKRGAQLLEVSPEGAKSIVKLAGIPIKMARSLRPGTFSQVLSELLEQAGSCALMIKDDAVTDILPYGARPTVDSEKLLNLIEKAVPVSDFPQVDILPDRVASIEVVGEKTSPVAKGELVRAGVKVVFSPMGTIDPSVQSYAQVLACTNGMTSNRILASFTGNGGGGGGEGDDVWHFFRQSVRKAYNSFEKVVSGYAKLRKENISPKDRAAMLESLIKQAGITGEIADAVRGMAIENPPTNAWEMTNLITYASSHLLEAGPRQRAQKIAAEFSDEESHSKTCPLCRRNR